MRPQACFGQGWVPMIQVIPVQTGRKFMATQRKRLGDLLLERRLITHDQLESALEQQRQTADALGEILVRSGAISEDLLVSALAAQNNVRAWHLEKDPPATSALSRVPGEVCKKYQVLPVLLQGDLLTLAMRDPNDLDAIDLVRNLSKCRVEPVLASEVRLCKAIEYFHSDRSDGMSVDSLVTQAMNEVSLKQLANAKVERAELNEETTRPVVGIVNQMLTDAIRMRASDIHIEPRYDAVEIRFRLDGQLKLIRTVPIALQPMLAARIKIMAEMDVVEYRLAQDGRISANLDGRTVDLRVSVLPNVHGQRIVLRVLDKAVALKGLPELGFEDNNLRIFRSLIHKPYGLFLVTGPTGSGKTTTLYAALSDVRTEANNVMTCEDPVEYELKGINQSQVNEKIGLSFAAQLRSILRQDPDVVLVGEIRDEETARTAMRAALTGHMVFSTLHCNDAASAVPRLLDMGIDPFLLSTSLIGVMAQRLLRELCAQCCEPYEPDEDSIHLIRHYLGEVPLEGLRRSVGCDACHQTGFRGRMGVHEILAVTPEVAKRIGSGESIEEIQRAAVETGFRTIQVDALSRVVAGRTSLEEAKRVVFFDDLTDSEPGTNVIRLFERAA